MESLAPELQEMILLEVSRPTWISCSETCSNWNQILGRHTIDDISKMEVTVPYLDPKRALRRELLRIGDFFSLARNHLSVGIFPSDTRNVCKMGSVPIIEHYRTCNWSFDWEEVLTGAILNTDSKVLDYLLELRNKGLQNTSKKHKKSYGFDGRYIKPIIDPEKLQKAREDILKGYRYWYYELLSK